MSEANTMPPSPSLPSKSRLVYVLLAFFLGTLGIHNFYAGYIARGLAQLAITLFLGWLYLPLLFVAIWVLAEIFFVNRDADGQPFEGSGCAVIVGVIAIVVISVFAARIWQHWYMEKTPATPPSAVSSTP